MHQESEALMRHHRAGSGDDSALKTLIAQHRTSLTLLIHNLARTREGGEESIMKPFAGPVAGCGRYRGQSSLKICLLGTSRKLALRQCRKVRGIPVDPGQINCLTPTQESIPRAEEDWLKREKAESLYAAIVRLHPAYRQALGAGFLPGTSQRDAARVMKKSQTQISRLIYKEKQAPRHILEAQELPCVQG